MTIEEAISFAAEKHQGQRDKAGEAYILHPLRVAIRLMNDRERLTAILHDVVKDAGVSAQELRARIPDDDVVNAIETLTKRAGETYTQFIERIAKNALASEVKLADIDDNLDPARLARLAPNEQLRLRLKYERARKLLARALRRPVTPRCAYWLHGGYGGRLQQDHIVPLARGGNNRSENLQWACATHNIDKGALTHEEYVEKLRKQGPPGCRPGRHRGRRRPWEELVGPGRPFERDALVALAEEEFGRWPRRRGECSTHIETIRRLPHEWLVFEPVIGAWQGLLNPRNLRPATADELRRARSAGQRHQT